LQNLSSKRYKSINNKFKKYFKNILTEYFEKNVKTNGVALQASCKLSHTLRLGCDWVATGLQLACNWNEHVESDRNELQPVGD